MSIPTDILEARKKHIESNKMTEADRWIEDGTRIIAEANALRKHGNRVRAHGYQLKHEAAEAIGYELPQSILDRFQWYYVPPKGDKNESTREDQ
jgi:hypothetical protein